MTASEGEVTPTTCRSCGLALTAGARFCTECGTPVRAPARRSAPPDRQQPTRLVECDACGAGNAASRPLCARCGTPLHDEIPGGDALPEVAVPAQPEVRARRSRPSDSPSVLLSLVVLAGLITAGVLLSLVTSRVTTPEVTAIRAGVDLRAASASTARDGHPASLVMDGDPATAWIADLQVGGPEQWIELRLAQLVDVDRIVLWNGDQGSEIRWTEHGWASGIRIEVDDRQFRVQLDHALGSQAIDLPGAVTADRLRIVVEAATPGTRHQDVAISEIAVEGDVIDDGAVEDG